MERNRRGKGGGWGMKGKSGMTVWIRVVKEDLMGRESLEHIASWIRLQACLNLSSVAKAEYHKTQLVYEQKLAWLVDLQAKKFKHTSPGESLCVVHITQQKWVPQREKMGWTHPFYQEPTHGITLKSNHAVQGMRVLCHKPAAHSLFARCHHVGILLTLWQSEPRTKGEHLQERFLGVVQTLQKDGFALICLIVVVFLDFILLGGNEIA